MNELLMKKLLRFFGSGAGRFALAAALLCNGSALTAAQSGPVPVPDPSGVSVIGTNLIWRGAISNMAAATNAAAPLPGWTCVATNHCGPGGSFYFVLPIEPDKPRRF